VHEYELGVDTIDRQIFPSVAKLKSATARHLASKALLLVLPLHMSLEQKHVAEAMEKQIKAGSVGMVPIEKEDNVGHFFFENYNSLSPWGDQKKVHDLNKLLKSYDADCALGVCNGIWPARRTGVFDWIECSFPAKTRNGPLPATMCMKVSTGLNTVVPVLLHSIASHNLYNQAAQIPMVLADGLGCRLARVKSPQELSVPTSPAAPNHPQTLTTSAFRRSTTTATFAPLVTNDAPEQFLLITSGNKYRYGKLLGSKSSYLPMQIVMCAKVYWPNS
jgi:hypothetical protein